MGLAVSIPLIPLIKRGHISFEKAHYVSDSFDYEILTAEIFHKNWGSQIREVDIFEDNGIPTINFNLGFNAPVRKILMDICKDLDIEYEEF
jgi:hypothetical protein